MAPRLGSRLLPLVATGCAIAGPVLLGVGILYGFAALIQPEPDAAVWWIVVPLGAAVDLLGLVLALVAARRRRWRGLAILALLVVAVLNGGILAAVLLFWLA